MRLVSSTRIVATHALIVVAWLSVVLGSSLAVSQSTGAANRETIIWGREVFAIPYQWSGQTDPSQASQVVLYLSRDAGATWRQVGAAEPHVQSFNYRAPGDGTYWFAVRTLDKTGQTWPAGPMTPELHVVIDTQIPTISSLAAAIDSTGRLGVGCVVQDVNLDPQSVSVAVLSGSGWQDVPVTHNQSATRSSLAVRGSLPMDAGVTQATVRVSVRDLAGNPTSAGTTAVTGGAPVAPLVRSAPQTTPQQQTFGFASAAVTPAATLPRNSALPSDPFLGQSSSFGPIGSPRSPAITTPARPSLGSSTTPIAQPPRRPTSGWRSGNVPSPSTYAGRSNSFAAKAPTNDTWAPDGLSRSPYRGETQPLKPTPATAPLLSSRGFSPQGPTQDPTLGTLNSPDPVYRTARTPSTFASLTPTPDPPPPFSALGNGLTNSAPAFRTTPLPQHTQFIGARRFELDYDVQSAGRWGVSKVTLWGTRDRGRTWRSFAVDSDNRSPLDVSVSGEGLYGFRILVAGVGGLAADPPQPGDAPEMYVEVDQTNPMVRLTAAHQGEGYFGDHLVINWQADDANLTDRPITISYAAHREGPWAAMASSIENSGRYAWRLQRHLPSQIYLRVEAQDAAGNKSIAVTPQPLAIELPQPTAKVRQVRPYGN